MNLALCSLLRRVQLHDPARRAVTVLTSGDQTSFGELLVAAASFRHGFERLGLSAGAPLACDLSPGVDFAALLLAAWESGLHLTLASPDIVDTVRLLDSTAPEIVISEHAPVPGKRARYISTAELGQIATPLRKPEPVDSPASMSLSASVDGSVESIGSAALLRSVENFTMRHQTASGGTMLSESSHLTLEGAFISTILPLALGLHVVIVGDAATTHPALLQTALESADIVELSGPSWRRLTRDTAVQVPARVQTLLVGSPGLHASEAAEVTSALGRSVQRGFGTPETGFWAVPIGDGGASHGNIVAEIRPLRSPLHCRGAVAGSRVGEIVLRQPDGDKLVHRTGSVGWISPDGTVEIAGRLSDVVIREAHAFLLSDLDRLLLGHPGVRASRTFREQGALPTEKAISVCVTDADETGLRGWLFGHADLVLRPDRLVAVAPERCSTLPDLPILRAVTSGRAGKAVVSALTARRFRRNPAYDEACLIAAVDRALLAGQPLNFLMFWGCGPRSLAGTPDRVAVAALDALFCAAKAAAPLRAHVHIIFTDLHATNNGHAEAHYSSYFNAIIELADGLDASFELESAVWRRGGLTKADILALEQEPSFAERWDHFPLQARFIQQAARHSRMADKVAAARHYYATCLLERDVLKSLFAGSVFLTYNGPEFNECFPDLPTLYVYPGPRGRNDKPWFVELADPAVTQEAPHVAAA